MITVVICVLYFSFSLFPYLFVVQLRIHASKWGYQQHRSRGNPGEKRENLGRTCWDNSRKKGEETGNKITRKYIVQRNIQMSD